MRNKKISSRVLFIALFCVLIVVVVTTVILLVNNDTPAEDYFGDDAVVATVNGFPITLREFRQSVPAVRADALQGLIIQGADQSDPDFWNTPVGGTTPVQAIRDAALEAAVHKKIIQIMAYEYGLIDDISYSRFFADMETEREQRADDLANNRPVFGSVHDREHESFALTIANLEGEVRIETAHMVRFTEEELFQAYQEVFSQFPVNPGVLHLIRIFAEFRYGDESSMAHALRTIEAIHELIMAGEEFITAAERFDMFVEIDDVHINLRRGMGQDRLRPLIQEAYGLLPGDVTGIIEEFNGYSIVQFVSHEGVRYAPFSEIRDIIHSRKAAEYYEEKLARLITEADVRTTAAFEMIGREEILYDT